MLAVAVLCFLAWVNGSLAWHQPLLRGVKVLDAVSCVIWHVGATSSAGDFQ